MGRITRVVGHDGRATLYEYDALGNRKKVRHEGGITVTYDYDACSRLINETVTDKDGSGLIYYSYTYGKAGERLTATETVRENGTAENARVIKNEYAYDELFRLTEESINIAEEVPFTEALTVSGDGSISLS